MLKTANRIRLNSLFVWIVPHDKVKTDKWCENHRPNKAQSKTKLELFADDSYGNGAEYIEATYCDKKP